MLNCDIEVYTYTIDSMYTTYLFLTCLVFLKIVFKGVIESRLKYLCSRFS